MRWVFGITITAGLAAFFLRVFESLSSDAIGMALGVLFGVLATIPVTLLVLAMTRGQQRQTPQPREPREPREHTHQRPMIVMMPSTPQQPQQQPSQWSVTPTLPPPPRLLMTSKGLDDNEQPGNFRIIGEEGSSW